MFLVTPFADIATGILILSSALSEGAVGSPSQVSRGILFAALLLFIKNDKRILYVSSFIIFLFCVEVFAALRSQDIMALTFGLISVSKVALIPLVYLALSNDSCSMNHVIKYFSFGLILVSSSVLIAFFTDTGFSTYGWGFGTKGYFSSGNGLGLFLGGSSFLLIYAIKEVKAVRLYVFVSLFLTWSALLLVASKTAFLLFFLSLGMYFFWNNFLYLAIFLLLISFATFGYLFDLVEPYFLIFISRYETSTSLVNFLFSGRVEYFQNAFEVFSSRPVGFLEWFIGNGVFCSYHGCHDQFEFDTLESDIADIFFSFGFVGVVIYCLFYFIVAKHLVKRKNIMCLIFFTLIYLHSLVAGHVIFNGMNAGLLGLLLYFCYFRYPTER